MGKHSRPDGGGIAVAEAPPVRRPAPSPRPSGVRPTPAPRPVAPAPPSPAEPAKPAAPAEPAPGRTANHRPRVDAATRRNQSRDRALVSAAATTLLSRLVSTIATIVILAVAAKALTSAQLGVVSVLTLLTIFLGFGDLGLGTLILTRLPAAHARGDEAGRREVVGTTLSVLLATALVIGGIGAISAFVAPWPSLLGAQHLPAGEVRSAVLAFFVSGAVAIPGGLGGRILAAMLRTAASQIWLAAGSVLSLAATIACAAVHAPMWAYVVAIAGAPGGLAAVQTGWVLLRSFPELRPGTLRWPLRTVGSYLRSASLYGIMTISAAIAYSIDSLVVSSILDASNAAIFAVAARLFSLVGTTIGLAGQQMWSALTDAVTRGDYAWVRSRYRHVLVISTLVTTVACGGLLLVGRPITRLWVGNHLVAPWSLLIALAGYTVLSTAVTQATYLLAAVERVSTIAALGLIMAGVNLMASVSFTHSVGLSGPILGSLVGLGAVMIGPVIVLTGRELRRLSPAPS